MNEIEVYRDACRPPNHAEIRNWLNRLSCCVRNPPHEKDAAVRYSAIIHVCADLPAGAWSEKTLLEAMRTFNFWPAAAEVYQLLKPHADRWRNIYALLQEPTVRESVEPYDLPTPPEQQRTMAQRPRFVEPRPLTPGQLAQARATKPEDNPWFVRLKLADSRAERGEE